MPEIQVGDISVHYDKQGEGEPLIMIPYLSGDHGCFAFQTPAYSAHFTCYPVDLRGTGATARGTGELTIPRFADDVAAFMQALGLDAAHIYGFSMGGAVGMRFAAAYPEKTLSLSLHSTWPRTDAYLRTVVESWQVMAAALDDMPEMVVQAMFPWCFTPETYAKRPDFIASVAAFVHSRPRQKVDDFLEHAQAVIEHDAMAELGKIEAPTQISFGALDQLTSTRFAEPMLRSIPNAELEIFPDCSHAQFFEDAENFNARTLAFLRANLGRGSVGKPTAATMAAIG